MKKIELYVIVGPTASGKTALALELAKHKNIEIISADSRQLFKYMTIGTAKPNSEEIAVCPHHFIDFLEPSEYYSAGIFGDEAEIRAKEIAARGNIPVVVGGSGLYVKSLCEGFFEDESTNEDVLKIRKILEAELAEKGREAMYEELKLVDPDSAEKYIDRNPRRIVRALEYFRANGEPFSSSQKVKSSKRNFDSYFFGIEYPREVLYDRINLRSEIMWQNGLPQETKSILDMGFQPNLNSLNTVGYKETIQFLNGEISELEAVEKIKQNTRRYAKRQLTWFRNQYPDMTWFGGDIASNAIEISNKIQSNLTKS